VPSFVLAGGTRDVLCYYAGSNETGPMGELTHSVPVPDPVTLAALLNQAALAPFDRRGQLPD